MSKLGDLLTSQRPDWGPLPAELEQAWTWMEERGFGADAPAGYALTPYDGDSELGVVFSADLELDSWFDGAAPSELLPLAEASGSGSMVALWRHGGDEKVVYLGSDGTTGILAENALEFLTFVAIGYVELVPFFLGEPPFEEEGIEAVAEFRDWLTETFDVTVPEEWRMIGNDEFSEWVSDVLG